SKNAEIDNGMRCSELADDQAAKPDYGENCQHKNEVRTEPVFLLAFIEQDLQRSDSQCQQPDPPIVNASTLTPQVGWIEDEGLGQENRYHPDGDVDVKHPAPTVIIGKPPTGDWSEHRRHYDSKRPE